MKEFFEEIVATIKDSKQKDEYDEVTNPEERYNAELSKEKLSKELKSENREELKIFGIIAIVVTIIVVIIISIFLIFRKSISNGLGNFVDKLIVKVEKILDENDFLLPEDNNQINCLNPYNGTYSGEYTINGQIFKETISITDNGTYSVSNNGIQTSTGNYLLDNKTITLNEEAFTEISSANYNYQISDDCKTLTRYSNDGTTIVLNIE